MAEITERTKDAGASEDRFALLWRRTKEHRIAQWTVGYIAVAYGMQHGIALTAEAFDWPHAVERVTMLLFILGLPLVIAFAWYHGERTARRISSGELSIVSLLLVAIAILFYVFVRPNEGAGIATQEASPAPARSTAQIPPGAISIAVLPAWTYAVADRYDEAANTLVAIQGNQVSRRAVEDAARLLRSRSHKETVTQLPAIEGEMGFVYAYVGAPERMLDASERALALGTLYTNTNGMFWLPQYTTLRMSEHFKTFARRAGMLDYWRAKGWPDLCHPIGADDFACD